MPLVCGPVRVGDIHVEKPAPGSVDADRSYNAPTSLGDDGNEVREMGDVIAAKIDGGHQGG